MRRWSRQPEEVRIVAVIQARMGSRRLPGKVLRRIGGHTLLAHIAHRLRRVRPLDAVVVATTERPEDRAIARESIRLGLPFMQGPEEDVLERYCRAAELFRADIVVRVTGDNPALDWGSARRTIRALMSGEWDYVSEVGLPKGCSVEAFRWDALLRARHKATQVEHREHVTLIMKQDRIAFKSLFLSAPLDCCRPDLSLSVDTEEDYQFVKRVMESCRAGVLSVTVKEILAGLEPDVGGPGAQSLLSQSLPVPAGGL